MTIDYSGLVDFGARNPVYAAAAVAALVIVAVMAWWAVRAMTRAVRAACRRSDDLLTLAVAGLATGMSAQGMWRFFDDVLHMPPALRVLMFGVFELAMLVEARRALRNIADPEIGTAGVDGAAVWVMAGLSAVLSATDADSLGGVLARLAAPLVAAWLWERGLSIERTRARRRDDDGERRRRSTIHWRITPERILVRLRLAEPTDRTAGDVDAHRRLAHLARAAMKVRMLGTAGGRDWFWRRKRALRRLNNAMAAAVEYASLATDLDRQQALLAQLGALGHAYELAERTPPAPWATNSTATNGADSAATDGATKGGHHGLMVAPGHTLMPGRGGPATEPATDSDAGPATTGANGAATSRPAAVPGTALTVTVGTRPHNGTAKTGNENTGKRGMVREKMREFWDSEIANGNVPSGADLNRAADCDPGYSLGKRYARQWRGELASPAPEGMAG